MFFLASNLVIIYHKVQKCALFLSSICHFWEFILRNSHERQCSSFFMVMFVSLKTLCVLGI